MKFKTSMHLLSLSALCITTSVFASEKSGEGYYGALNLVDTHQEAKSMSLSERPGIGSFVSGDDKENKLNGSLAVGYQYGNNWRTEAEYVFKRNYEYTSGSSAFSTSFNHMQTESERVMLNVYRDFKVSDTFSFFASAGAGVAKIKVGGWQGNQMREFIGNTQTNLTWSVGAGVSYNIIDNLSLSAMYRYVDMGNVESGRNAFTNGRGLQDENLRAHLVNNEFLFGVRYVL